MTGVVVSAIWLYAAYWSFAHGSMIAGVVLVLIAAAWLWGTFSNGAAEVAKMEQDEVNNLKKNGQRVLTTFKAIDRDWQSEAAGESPTVIYSQDANKRTYHSKDLWFSGKDTESYDDRLFKLWQKLQVMDPAMYNKVVIPVYINPTNQQEYYMDLVNAVIQE